MEEIINALTSLEGVGSAVLVLAWLALLRSLRCTGYGIALLSLGATWLHECCHLIVGAVLFARPASFSLWPRREGNYWVLGSVGFRGLNIWNAAPVAMAPLLMLPLSGLLFTYGMVPALAASDYAQWILIGYFVACCFFAGWPSLVDLKVGALSTLMYGAIVYGLWYAAW